MTQPQPEQAARLQQLKAQIPPNRTANHGLLDYLIETTQNGVAPQAQAAHVDQLLTKLTVAHLETTTIVLGG